MTSKTWPALSFGSSRYSFRLYILCTLLFSLPIGGCSVLRTPYATDVEAIDEKSNQEAARIRLSPPQVFTREQLINDRLTETGFLNDKLSASANATLGTSLARDLQTITAISAQLSVSSDQATKFNFQKLSQLADLQQQIDVVQLQGQLLTAKNQLQALQNGTGAGPSALSPSPSTTVTNTDTSTSSSDAQIKALQGRIDSALSAIANLGATTRTNTVTGTLEDDFEDRLALRTRIREAINANALDDSHDHDGNALYHLQFIATLLPGEHKNQFGIASIQVKPPEFDIKEISILYNSWLAEITNRLNPSIDEEDNLVSDETYRMLGPVTGLYDVAEIEIQKPNSNDPKKTFKLLLAVRPGDKEQIEKLYKRQFDIASSLSLDFNSLAQNLDNKLIQTLNAKANAKADAKTTPEKLTAAETAATDALDCFKTVRDEFIVFRTTGNKQISAKALDCIQDSGNLKINKTPQSPPQPSKEKIEEDILTINKLLSVRQSIEASFLAIGDRSIIPKKIKESAQKFFERYNQKFFTEYNSKLSGSKVFGAIAPPNDFCRALFEDNAHNPLGCDKLLKKNVAEVRAEVRVVGKTFPYAVDPVLRSQRISTVASAANAIDLAAALTAQLPQSGIGVGADLGYARRAAGRADTIERVPQVFGFAGPTEQDSQEYEFGWVFGPKLSLDASDNTLLLRQVARTQQVSADVSVPSWWPYATLKVSTAWKGNFAGKGSVLSGGLPGVDGLSDSYNIHVNFNNLNQAALDELTVYLTRELTQQGFHQPRIDRVEPSVFPVCSDAANKNITLLIYGLDLWRNPKVFLGGQPLSNISVLPDMIGISAVVDTSTLSKAALDKDNNLVVWTTRGEADFPLNNKISSTCEGLVGEAPNKSQDGKTSIIAVSPSQISMCDPSVDIVVMGKGLADSADKYYLGTLAAKGISPEPTVEDKNEVKTVSFDSPLKDKNKGLTTLSLTMISHDGMVSTPIDVGGADCSASKPAISALSTFAFTKTTTTLPPGKDNTGTLRVSLTFPAGQKSSVDIKATKGGEIIKGDFADAKHPKALTLKNKGGVVTVTTTVPADKEPKPAVIELKLRNLVEGESLQITATANPADKSKIDPISLVVPVNSKALPEVAAPPKPSPQPQPFTFTNGIKAITPASDGTATMRVLLTFPSGKASSIVITAKGGEIIKSAFTDSAPPANLSLQLSNGAVKLSTSVSPADTKSIGIDLTFRDLVIGNQLILNAAASPKTKIKEGPITVDVVSEVKK